jgi:hypothetical protein
MVSSGNVIVLQCPGIDSPIKVDQTSASHPFSIPETAMYGWIADKAKTLGAPLGWAYCSLLSLFAGVGNITSRQDDVRSNLIVCLIADKGVGKSRSVKRARQSRVRRVRRR